MVPDYFAAPSGKPDDLQRPVRLTVRTPDFHSGNRGSIPLRVAIVFLELPAFSRAFSFGGGSTGEVLVFRHEIGLVVKSRER